MAEPTGYVTEAQWRAIFHRAADEADIPFNRTACQVRHSHASMLIAEADAYNITGGAS